MTGKPKIDERSSEARLRRAMRQLRRSGRRLVQREDGWAVMFSGNSVAPLAAEEVAFLAAEGHVVPAENGGWVAAAAAVAETTYAPDSPPSGAWVFEATGCARPRLPGQGFEKLARRARAGDSSLSLRQATAGLRLIADAEAAARTGGLTMDWDRAAIDRQRRRAREGGLPRSAAEAARRLRRIAASVGESGFALVWRACIEGRPISRLAAEAGIAHGSLVRRLSVTLEAVATAYDQGR